MPSTDNVDDRPRTRRRNRADLNLNLTCDTSSYSFASTQLASDDAVPLQFQFPHPPSHPQPETPSPPLSKSYPDPDSRALRLPSSSRHPHESFLDNPTPVEDDMADRLPRTNPRDSHDLSLSPRNVTRDSLVTNMLLSLDQFSMAQLSDKYGPGPRSHTYDDVVAPQSRGGPDNQRTWTTTSAHNGNGRAQGHQYSYSSDIEGGDDSSRISSRGRRSNSSSNYQPGFGRLGSVRESSHRAQTATTRAMHSRGGKPGSKNSSSTGASIDNGYAQVLGSQRWARGFGRSASFDYGPSPEHNAPSPGGPPILESTPFRVEFPNNFLADDYDAAPEPTVPGGPRRELLTRPTMQPVPLPPPAPLEPPSLEHKHSSRSLRNAPVRSKSGGNLREPAPTLPSLDLDSAPAPHVGYEKSKDVVVAPTPAPAPAPPPVKERPGFFRRVFGSRSSSNSHQNTNQDTAHTTQPSPAADQSGGNKSANTQTPPSRDASSSHSHHPVLQKRPSSFFRRRKKSISEDPPPPLPTANPVPPMPHLVPINATPKGGWTVPMPEPSPVSSLRKVMNPYLRSGANGPATPQGPSPLADATNLSPEAGDDDGLDRVEYKREFSPDYSPSPNAKIRTVNVESDDYDVHHVDTPSRSAPQRPTKAIETRNNSFLDLDGGSDNELGPDSPSGKKHKSRSNNHTGDYTPKRADSTNDSTIRGKKTMRIEHPDSEDDFSPSNLALPIEGARAASPASASTGTDYKSAISAPPSVRIEGSADPSPKGLGSFDDIKSKPLDEPEFVIGDPTEDDRQKAQNIYDGNEDFISKEKAASWMGEEGPIRQRTLQAYMELYDFTSHSIVHALREVCCRLILRAETQQVDRILVAFSKRWCDCNPNHGFKATDVIHTICYSIMLLNTDLHVADIEQKMTRGQFIKNTMTTITQAVSESVPDAFHRPSILPEKNGMLNGDDQEPADQDRKSFRHSFRPPPRADLNALGDDDDCGPLVKAPFSGSKKAWEEQIEVVLKGIYTSIRDQRLPLFGAEAERNINMSASHSGGLSVMGMLKRTPSVLSKAPSESQLSVRGRINENGRPSTTTRWASKSRTRNGVGRNGFSSSRTSFEDGGSIWSPAGSSATWSRQSLGRTQTSVSQDSFGSAMPRGEFQQSIGFANALSQAIIRDEDMYGDGAHSVLSADISSAQLLEDESLELAGPPWVKEGMVIHKHHLDGVEKKAKDRHWGEVFAVIQKGQMSLFSFAPNKSMRQKNRKNAGNTVVGGGNWQDNATNMGTFSLRQTLASALPPPGYSRTRPHVWALSLPTGAVHLFQVGTPEIGKEFVTTVNYWSARLSTHPLIGGISNIEYGWSEAVVNNALVSVINETSGGKTSRPGSAAAGRRSSVTSANFRGSSFDHVTGAFTNNSGRGKLPGDRIYISDWSPPTQSMRPSNMSESEQLETLDTYVKSIEAELQTHNQLRSPMLLAFTPRGANASKAMNNWERKSAYLLREIVKFRTYVDCLQQAETRKNEIYAERDLAQRAARGELSDGDMELSGGEEGDITLRP
ncbi:hypothetical protein BGZ63DRAFT_354521 [Mariannaea sp. PMI_226]|nr:hypothetical protein BGZ63DRAFT_354521 [Mariannaea sp. PMI_226]